ncbi:hypothetical protein GH714_007545 [Hevea brasiliensis]|uniref:Uncharacterized protein n=1 Tax=Hevea brasiliensis TaxID=3981 RepID=A0A6A6MWY9_HEVBR|nr:hypothetical protein GH714_007545 [Hevea brasiliensis]
MGNVFQIQFGDALIDRCWDCIAGQVLYLCQFEDYLQDLETARDKLQELMNDVMRMVISEETPQTVKLDREGGWLSWVDATIIEVNALLNRATQERQKLFIASCCSKNYKSSYMFGKSVCRSFKHVVALMSEGEFKEMVIRAPAVQLQADLEALWTAKQELWALKEDVKRKITLEEGQQKKALQQVQLIAKKLEDVIAVKGKGDFKEVVEWALPEPVTVAKECKGLPIAFINIGRAMSSRITMDLWKNGSMLLRTFIEQLPVELKMLVNLKYLNLEHNFKLNMIPRGVISGLSSLQVLRMYGKELTSTIRSVSVLQSFISIHTLLNCTRGLRFELFPGAQSLNIWWLANMKNLVIIDVIGKGNSEELGFDVVMEDIATHHAAGSLGNSMISRETWFNNLRTLILESNLRLRDLTRLILAPNLSHLNMYKNNHMEEIISVEKLDDVQVWDENFNHF